MKKIDVEQVKPFYEYRFYMKSGAIFMSTVSRVDERHIYITDGWRLDVRVSVDFDDEGDTVLLKKNIDCVYDEGDIFNDYVALRYGKKTRDNESFSE